MPRLFYRYATPLIFGLFMISLISGIALFFHVGPSGFRGMHEWLSMVLIVPFVLHLWRNLRPMTGYFKHLPMAVAVVLSLVMALPFVMPRQGATGPGRAGPPQFAFAAQVMRSPAEVLAPALGLSVAELSARLATAGVALNDPTVPVADAISAAGVGPGKAMAALMGR